MTLVIKNFWAKLFRLSVPGLRIFKALKVYIILNRKGNILTCFDMIRPHQIWDRLAEFTTPTIHFFSSWSSRAFGKCMTFSFIKPKPAMSFMRHVHLDISADAGGEENYPLRWSRDCCGWICVAFREGKRGCFPLGEDSCTVVWRFIRQPTEQRGGHRSIFSWSMKDTIMVVSVFVVTLGTGCLIIWTSPLQIQAAKVIAISYS